VWAVMNVVGAWCEAIRRGRVMAVRFRPRLDYKSYLCVQFWLKSGTNTGTKLGTKLGTNSGTKTGTIPKTIRH